MKDVPGKTPEPRAGRPHLPKGYGVAESSVGLLPWTHIDARMSGARNYWIGTARPDGRPHAMPVWGVWLDGTFYFGTDRSSRKSRNLQHNPAVVVHLESGDEVVIIEGIASEYRGELAPIDQAYAAKYGMKLSEAPGDLVIYAVAPATAFAWSENEFPRNATRWRLRAPSANQP
jgi:hypothetical protein